MSVSEQDKKNLAAGYALAEIRKDFVGVVVNFKSSAIIPKNLSSVSEQDKKTLLRAMPLQRLGRILSE